MTARAVAIIAHEEARLVEVPAPGELGANQLRGPTLCSLMSPGTELAWYYHGKSFPGYPGYAAVFQVEEIGVDVAGWKKGDVAFTMGGHRSVQQAAAETCVPVPEGLAPDVATLARLMGVSMTTLMTTAARPGERVLVTGAGPVGYLAAQQFAHAGYEVSVVEPDATRREAFEGTGIPALTAAPEDGDFALVVECSGHEAATLAACKAVRKRGEVVLVGVPWEKKTELTAHDLLHVVFHKYVVLRSGWEWELPRQPGHFQPLSIHGNFATALRWLAEGAIPVGALLRLVDPAACQEAYQDHLHHRCKELFTVFDWR